MSKVWGESNREISMVLACVIRRWRISENSARLRLRLQAVSFGLWCLTCAMKCKMELFCEIVEPLWCFPDKFWTLLVSPAVVCNGFSWFPMVVRYAYSPVPVLPLLFTGAVVRSSLEQVHMIPSPLPPPPHPKNENSLSAFRLVLSVCVRCLFEVLKCVF